MKKLVVAVCGELMLCGTLLAQNFPLEPCHGYPDYQRYTGWWETYCPADQDHRLVELGYNHCVRPGRTFTVSFKTWALGVGALEHGQRAGEPGAAWHTDTTIAYWLYSPDNVEAIVKVLDGRAVNGHWWLDYAPLTDQHVRLVVGPTCQTLLDDNTWQEDWWVIESGPAWKLGLAEYELDDGTPNPRADLVAICAYPLGTEISVTIDRWPYRRDACALKTRANAAVSRIGGAWHFEQRGASTLSLRDAWNQDGVIPAKYYKMIDGIPIPD